MVHGPVNNRGRAPTLKPVFMKRNIFPLSPKASDWFVTLYVLATLWGRFLLESQLQGHSLISIGIGAFSLLFIWALMKSKFINPSFFGMYEPHEQEEAKETLAGNVQ